MWEKSTRSGEAQQLRGEIPIHHRYTLGVAGERFFKAMRDERRAAGVEVSEVPGDLLTAEDVL